MATTARTPAAISAIADNLAAFWGAAPRVTLACAGGSDEHWQIAHPDDELPTLVVTADPTGDGWAVTGDGWVVARHPDGRNIA